MCTMTHIFKKCLNISFISMCEIEVSVKVNHSTICCYGPSPSHSLGGGVDSACWFRKGFVMASALNTCCCLCLDTYFVYAHVLHLSALCMWLSWAPSVYKQEDTQWFTPHTCLFQQYQHFLYYAYSYMTSRPLSSKKQNPSLTLMHTMCYRRYIQIW